MLSPLLSDSCSMSIKLGNTSGVYHVRGMEMSREKSLKTVKCIVHFLDDSDMTFEIDVSI